MRSEVEQVGGERSHPATSTKAPGTAGAKNRKSQNHSQRDDTDDQGRTVDIAQSAELA